MYDQRGLEYLTETAGHKLTLGYKCCQDQSQRSSTRVLVRDSHEIDKFCHFLSPPVPMHGGLLCVALRLSVCLTRKKVTRKKAHQKKNHISEYTTLIGQYVKNMYYTLRKKSVLTCNFSLYFMLFIASGHTANVKLLDKICKNYVLHSKKKIRVNI